MQQVSSIDVKDLMAMAKRRYGDFVKAVVDVRRRTMVVDAELHADEEQYLLEHGSNQDDLWGINLYPADFGTEDLVEFDSLINIRPLQGNRSRDVTNAAIREAIHEIVGAIVHG